MAIYYENILANHNYTAKPNIAWAADITEIDLSFQRRNKTQNPEFFLFESFLVILNSPHDLANPNEPQACKNII